jgi:16S rRNA processing protein RimM
MKIEDCFYVGYITKAKGLKGEVQIFLEYPAPADLKFDSVFLEINGKLVPYFVSSYKLRPNQTGNFFFDDVDTIEKAEKLIRKKVYLPNSVMPEKDPEDFSWFDLKGYIVHDEHYGELGEIIEVHEYPQQYVAVVPFRFREIMFPLNDEIVQSIDEEKGTLQVILPDGLVDVYLNQ